MILGVFSNLNDSTILYLSTLAAIDCKEEQQNVVSLTYSLSSYCCHAFQIRKKKMENFLLIEERSFTRFLGGSSN